MDVEDRIETLFLAFDQMRDELFTLRDRIKQLESMPSARDWRGYCEEQARDKGEK